MMTQELDLEDPLAIVTRLNADDGAALIAALTDDEAQTLVDRLKAGADKYWAINPNRSLEMADTIIMIAEERDNLSHKALGMMARGDALKLLGHSQEAWDMLGEAGDLFLQIGDEVGWARTRIGRTSISININKVSEALVDTEDAHKIFLQQNKHSFLVRLDTNIAGLYYWLGDDRAALRWFYNAISEAQGEPTERQFLGVIYMNIGVVYWHLRGDSHKALSYLQQGLISAQEYNEVRNVALIKLNMAFIHMGQGNFLLALQMLYHSRDLYEKEEILSEVNQVNHVIVECFYLLNRLVEARDLAISVIANFHECNESYNEARTLLHLASIEAEIGDLAASQKALNAAESLFKDIKANSWIAITQLRQGRLAFNSGDIDTAYTIATQIVTFFASSNQPVNYGMAILLQSQTCFALKNLKEAHNAALVALKMARNANIPLLRYGSHLLLGKISEKQEKFIDAARHYGAANTAIERVQQGLILDLQTDFMEDKLEAFHALMRLHIQGGNYTSAFEILERAKSRTFLSYITNHHLQHWSKNASESVKLSQELEQLRGEHYWWYQKAHHNEAMMEERAKPNEISVETALKELTVRERRMRSITEQLYIQSSTNDVLLTANALRLQDIQDSLDEETLLIEFYYDDSYIWAFLVGKTTCDAYPLSASVAEIERNLNFLHFNIDTVLNLQNGDVQHVALIKQIQFLLRQFYAGLLSSFATKLLGYHKLVFIPYGALHYLPFHLLYSESDYLIQHHEIIILPAAGYVTQAGPKRTGGARVIAHSFHSTLPNAIGEAQFVHDLFGGTVYVEDDASRSALQGESAQILHIAAHAEYRQQQPDLSYIELADGHLFTNDLFQQDMSYELVTLSACETGRAHVAATDELIGLGRGFLYAGAGALVTSLWRVTDGVAPRLMQHFYRDLHAGASKSAALRDAQLAILRENPQMHPAFWGAFQLVGDPQPLSTHSNTQTGE